MKRLGGTATAVAEVGIGTWRYNAGPGPLRKGLEAGALFVDTAESYGTEETVGLAIRGMRQSVFIATKVSPQNYRFNDFKRSAETSLLKLGVQEIDLLQLHEPSSTIPISETMAAMGSLIEEGKVRYAGLSNFSVSQLEEAQLALGRHSIVSNQVRYSMIDRTIEGDLLPYCQKNSITVIAYSPLGREFSRILDCDPDHVITAIGKETGRTPAQIVLNWCLCKDGVIVIPKGNTEAHILDNCGASGWRLTEEQVARLDSRIRHRKRGRFDGMVRRFMPAPLRTAALRAAAIMPPGLRRRFL